MDRVGAGEVSDGFRGGDGVGQGWGRGHCWTGFREDAALDGFGEGVVLDEVGERVVLYGVGGWGGVER
ncbi:hypothetical protein chiPu_0024880, partial [Chiloscyllium punctatum]|nr:hypothetical protein [Chiloscyllium punctatum]